MTFTSLGLSQDLLKTLEQSGYQLPTPVQTQAIPVILAGRDVQVTAQTGTGKTAAFVVPILQRLISQPQRDSRLIRVLILVPTRELAAQVGESVHGFSRYLPWRLKCEVVFGGVKINPQMMRLRGGADVLVATPGRLLELVEKNAVKLPKVETLVLDEADRMLDLGFWPDLSKILTLLPNTRQNLLFSATFSTEISRLAQDFMRAPVFIEVGAAYAPAELVEQRVYTVNQTRKTALLSHLISEGGWRQVLVFIGSKHGANRLADKLQRAGITAAAFHGDKNQGARAKVLADFKAGKVQVLVATDLAARGIDIEKLPFVVNFELPRSPAEYVHRIGRTGRACETGLAVSLISPEEFKAFKVIEKLIGTCLEKEQVPRFEL